MSNDLTNQPQRATFDDVEDAADAILGRWSDDESPTDREDEEATSEDNIEETDAFEDYEEDETDLDEEDTEENLEDPDEEETAEDETEEASEEEFEELTDETLVEIPVNGEIKQASIKELKRLYGQEASLTRKSQETATKRKEAEDIIQKTSMSYQKLIERAEARFKPYSEVDMLVASRQMDADDFAQLRKEAQEAESDLKFLKEESDAFFKEAQADYQKQHQAAAQECVRVLQDNLPDWGNDLYNDIRSYAVSVGLPQDQVDQYVDPNVIMILNKARLYDMGKAAADQKKSKAVRIKSAGKKVLRSRKAPATDADLRVQRQRKASQKLRSNPSISGDLDDIADALMSRWEQ